jgi:GntR family transcriptional regulator, transcriptional repressor for pyruvate dehydrogenase complex
MLNEQPPGSEGKLPTERMLADQFGISRRSVRRALEVLEAEGRVWRKQGSGTFAGPRPDRSAADIVPIAADTDFMEVMEVRLRIEPQLAQLAALRAKAEAVERMREILHRLDETEDSDSRELWDSALHRQIAKCAGNTFFLAIFDLVDRVRQDAAWQSIRARARSSRQLAVYADQHRTIVDAIAHRDPVKAGEAMRRHLMTLHDNLIRQTSLESLSDVG